MNPLTKNSTEVSYRELPEYIERLEADIRYQQRNYIFANEMGNESAKIEISTQLTMLQGFLSMAYQKLSVGWLTPEPVNA